MAGVALLMGDDFIPLHDLSDRELLILAATGVNDVKKELRALNGRVRNLEKWRDRIVGGFGIVTGLSGLAEYLFHRK